MGQVQSMRCIFVYVIYIYLHKSAGCQLVCLSEWSQDRKSLRQISPLQYRNFMETKLILYILLYEWL